MKKNIICIYFCCILFTLGCSKTQEDIPYSKLSMYGFFKDLKKQVPAENVYAYNLNTPLFSDYTSKKRFIYLPKGTAMEYHNEESFVFPHGSVIIKTFSMPFDMTQPEKGEKLLETRLLVNHSGTWKAYPYIWNEDETDAVLELVGDTINLSWIHYDGQKRVDYIVPNVNDCKSCHSIDNKVAPIGPKAKNLNISFLCYNGETFNQLDDWQELGILTKVEGIIPFMADWDNEATGDISARARAYLDVNCAHCHRPEGPASNAGLDFRSEHSDMEKLGVYKAPIAAGHGTGGREYDIVPGKPEESIVVYRMESTEPKIAMPEFGRSLIHEEGVSLIAEWIRQITITEKE